MGYWYTGIQAAFDGEPQVELVYHNGKNCLVSATGKHPGVVGTDVPSDSAESTGELLDRLRRLAIIPDDAEPVVTALSGGVSNDVLGVTAGNASVVIKRALPRLRVSEEWLASPERVITEARALRLAADIEPGAVPGVIALDADHHFAVIERAPLDYVEWKSELLAGRVELDIASSLGATLAHWHLATGLEGETPSDFWDLNSFMQLRVDPFYYRVRERHPDLIVQISTLVDRLLSTRKCLVHGDFSPKNVLVGRGALWVIDWEVAHIGDPTFDLAFLLSHLACKALHRPASAERYQAAGEAFLHSYRQSVGAGLAAYDDGYLIAQIACLVLARVDGKSPMPYLAEDSRVRARQLARALLVHPNPTWSDLWTPVP